MITALSISDFALIDSLSLHADADFTALTGQTGAGKSIILDALGIVLGMRPSKRFIRAGAKRASISATFRISPNHPVWETLASFGIEIDCDAPLVLKRIIPRSGGVRSFINDRALSSARLSSVGEQLVEISSQHAASNLLKPAYCRQLLDVFAGNDTLLQRYRSAWTGLTQARELRTALEARMTTVSEQEAHLQHMISELETLMPEVGETTRLAAERSQRMQSERLSGVVRESLTTFEHSNIDTLLASALSSLERVANLPGFSGDDSGELPLALRQVMESLERANIEISESVIGLNGLAELVIADEDALERAEARLFALKAAARKHRVEPDQLRAELDHLKNEHALIRHGEEELRKARARETDAAARWRTAADKLSRARKAAAKRLQKAWQAELPPLKLSGARVRISVEVLEEGCADFNGNDAVCIDVETNSGAGFGPLREIASGGELARFSLALKCAAATAQNQICTLIFDEADQGVGGAVAAAIGERLLRLAENCQVFAVTHSPQVAAAATTQWQIDKTSSKKDGKGLGQTHVRVLDAKTRKEEIARMLSGLKVTPEARAAATRLLEG